MRQLIRANGTRTWKSAPSHYRDLKYRPGSVMYPHRGQPRIKKARGEPGQTTLGIKTRQGEDGWGVGREGLGFAIRATRSPSIESVDRRDTGGGRLTQIDLDRPLQGVGVDITVGGRGKAGPVAEAFDPPRIDAVLGKGLRDVVDPSL